MRVLILGGDGYLGWPTAMDMAAKGHEVCIMDNYMRRNIARETCSEALMQNPNMHERAQIFEELSGKRIQVVVGDCTDFRVLADVVRDFAPEAVVHYAEQPSAPYSMRGFAEASVTFHNNLGYPAICPRLSHHQAGYHGRIRYPEYRHRRGLA